MSGGQRSEVGEPKGNTVRRVERLLVALVAVLVGAIPTSELAPILFALSLGALVALSVVEYRIRRRWTIH